MTTTMAEIKMDQVQQELKAYLQDLFSLIHEQLTIDISIDKAGELYINLKGSPTIFTLEYPESVDALSTFLETLLKRKFNVERRVWLDINGAKKEKRDQLIEFVRDAAQKAKKQSTRIRLNPMPPAKRKWIHITLSEVSGVKTYSVGHGDDRRVIIEPKSKNLRQ